MFHLQGIPVSPFLGQLLIPAPAPEAAVTETLTRRSTPAPSPPHVSTRIFSSPHFLVQRGPERCDLSSLFFRLQSPGHSRSRLFLGTDETCPERHILPRILHQGLRHLQAPQDLALRNLALGSATPLGVPTLLIYLISFTVIHNLMHCSAPSHPPGRSFIVHLVVRHLSQPRPLNTSFRAIFIKISI